MRWASGGGIWWGLRRFHWTESCVDCWTTYLCRRAGTSRHGGMVRLVLTRRECGVDFRWGQFRFSSCCGAAQYGWNCHLPSLDWTIGLTLRVLASCAFSLARFGYRRLQNWHECFAVGCRSLMPLIVFCSLQCWRGGGEVRTCCPLRTAGR